MPKTLSLKTHLYYSLIYSEFNYMCSLKYSSNPTSHYSFNIILNYHTKKGVLSDTNISMIMNAAKNYPTSGHISDIRVSYNNRVIITFDYEREFAHKMCIENYGRKFAKIIDSVKN